MMTNRTTKRTAKRPTKRHVIYECGICSCYHPWNWNGDCRDDKNRYSSPEEYGKQHGLSGMFHCLEVRTWEERVEADQN